ncbi:TonB-dependent Receptor Plug Domain [Daejeonella rubra]|uniref:TonB-dependent Receptor Plug Domain n=1 Tax=Daejeonella rubra TaxID=990371 RepID=A0A1G9X1W6_9SPHI|nr:TonB-dependent receptor plug domain-containing protein [Daejeonella rubra]SDM90541.1 TonB-dependent Receptor Plug Domain [Daejeonella rubra]
MNLLKLYRLLFTFLLGIFTGESFGQEKTIEEQLDYSNKILNSVSTEKVHLHLDKPYYASGQTVWFKAYLINADKRPSTLSKILYVDLIDSQNSIIRSLKLPISAGLATGDIWLSDTLKTGNYRIRAYTQWMRNFGEAAFYNQTIYVGNILFEDIITQSVKSDTLFGSSNQIENSINKSSVFKSTSNIIQIQFFPEGGNLVDSIRSNVAFKATGPNGLGIDFIGYVLDEKGTRVADFQSEHAGMGKFRLTPYGTSHTAVIALNGEKFRIMLPKAEKEGYVLTVLKEDDNNLFIRVSRSNSIFNKNRNQQLSLVAQSGSQIYNLSKFNISNQFVDVTFPKQELPTGISQLTLFDQHSIPRAERLVFIQHQDQIKLILSSNKKLYQQREKVVMELSASAIGSQPIIGSFSISVTDLNHVPTSELDANTILSNILIKSELKGFVEKPNYYFQDTSILRRKHLDNLLLTQGWRNISLKQIFNNDTLARSSYQAEKGINISGIVTMRGNTVAGGKVSLFTPEGGIFLDTVTNHEGRFKFENLVFADSTRFILQARSSKEKDNMQIRLDKTPFQEAGTNFNYFGIENKVNNEFLTYLKDNRDELEGFNKKEIMIRTKMLNEVVVKAVRNYKNIEGSSKLGSTPADFVFRQEDLSGSELGSALEGKIVGLNIKYDPGSKKTTASLSRNNLLNKSPAMRLFVDGADWGDDLNAINVSDIAMVEVLKGGANGAIYGNNGFGGVILVTTKLFAGLPADIIQEPKGIIKFTPVGYTITREFYSPDYNSPDNKGDIKDLRSTVYWNPDLFINKGKSLTLEFYTPDKSGKYQAIVEGLDYLGRFGRQIYTFNVK